MDKLKLAWETFNFLTSECAKQEEIHSNNILTLGNFFKKNNYPSKAQRLRMKNKLNKTSDYLMTLYKKQSDSLEDLISMNKDYVDIPEELEVKVESLLSLKNMTFTLMKQVSKQKSQFIDLLG